MSEEITVARALRKLDTLKKRIEKKLGLEKDPPVGFVRGIQNNNTVPGFKSNDDFIAKAKAEFQSISDLIRERNAIKAAIVKSNAETSLKVKDKEMTVAEAIEHKTGIMYDKQLLDTLRRQFTQATADINRKNELVEREAHTAASQINKDGESNDYKVVFEAIMEKRGWSVVALPDINDVIEKLDAEIDDFESEINLALNTSNVLTILSF